jgi:Flp pilus assembly protein TadD
MATRAADRETFRLDRALQMPMRAGIAESEAMGSLTGIVERDPEFVEAFTGLPNNEMDAEVFEVLGETIRQAIERRPHDAELQHQHAAVLARLGRVDDAALAAERAVALDDQHIRARIHLADLYRDQQRTEEAIEQLGHVVRLGAKYADVFMSLGCLYRQADRSEQAREAFAQALEINCDFGEARAALEALPA